MPKIKLLILLLPLFTNFVLGELRLTKAEDRIIIENSLIQRVIEISNNKGMPIHSIYINKSDNKKIADNESGWFSFNLNNKIVSSENPDWVFKSISEREMLNDGKEITLSFTNIQFAGLLLSIIVQAYDESKFYREKISISANDNKEFKLTKVNGKVDFTFAGLSSSIESNEVVSIEEIRMASWNEKLLDTDYSSSFNNRMLEKDWRVGRNLEQNYMYHPKRILSNTHKEKSHSVKGPFLIVQTSNIGFWIAYEHGSPDNDPEQTYVTINLKNNDDKFFVNLSLKEGAYFDGQIIKDESFTTPWYAYNFYKGNKFDRAESQIWNYLNNYICENSASRKPMFYYNTWGMQRDESKRGNDIRGILTEDKIRKEIDIVSELGVDLFVLDDGWQDKFGDWNPNEERFSNGLQFYVDKCKAKGIVPGIWMAAHATDSIAVITKTHPNWLIRETDGTPIVGQWKKNFFCFDSDYKNYFIEKCKGLIDQGIRYFKWDGVNNYICSSSKHNHGDENISALEREKILGYKLPLEVADAIKKLKEYQPDVVIEIDVTEPNRCVGLAILSEARYFWMNNGAAWYGDYSTYRAKSMRMITNLFGGFLPPVLQTYANFPMNDNIYQAQHYNANSSLIGGRGFWGNISRMKQEDRLRVGKLVNKIKRVENDAVNVRPVITGKVGSSPEIYEYVNKEKSSGKIIAFSGSALKYDYSVAGIDPKNLLGVLNNSYRVSDDSLLLELDFYFPEDSKEAILLNNNDVAISIIESTSWLENIELDKENKLLFINGAPGIHIIKWAKKLGEPRIEYDKNIESKIDASDDKYLIITIKTIEEFTSITLEGKE